IPATILERAGVKPYFGMQGQSFLDCLGDGAGQRQSVFIEYNDGLARSGFDKPARVRSVVTHDWQLSVYKDQDWGELYDRRTDQRQTHNLWDDADHAAVRAEMFELLTAHLINQMDESPRSERLA
ncbi:MAG: sulfatase/phosphatase domain-containing protein, partial [Pseudomonadota bacterium]